MSNIREDRQTSDSAPQDTFTLPELTIEILALIRKETGCCEENDKTLSKKELNELDFDECEISILAKELSEQYVDIPDGEITLSSTPHDIIQLVWNLMPDDEAPT